MSFGLPAIAGPVVSSKRLKQLAPFAIAIVCGFTVVDQLGDVDVRTVKASIASVTITQWIGALFATAVSFLAVGQYDALFHRWLGTGVSNRRGVISGASSIALAQTLGMGLVTGTLARWRLLPDLSLATCLKVTNYVSFSFMVGLGLVSIFVLALPGAGHLGASAFSAIALGVVLFVVLISFAQPRWLPFPLPPLRMSMRLVALVTVDVVMCAAAFWILIPPDLQPAFPALLAAFTLALGAGLLSGAPGGVGPFELCLITLMPALPEPELIATVLAFRLVYYAAPAVIAAILMIRPAPAVQPVHLPMPRPAIKRAEAKLAFQTEHSFLPIDAGDALHVGAASQMLVAIGDTALNQPLSTRALTALEQKADARSQWPVLYKCSSRSAVCARKMGWSTALLSEEAWLDPGYFALDVPERRQLRRKLKKAEKAGIRVTCSDHLPLAEMAEIAADWAARVGGERGFSMGRFEEAAIAEQRVYLAWQGDRLVAFATFHETGFEWTLDLMRSRSDMPDGTMHDIIRHALTDAKDQGIQRVSLAAMPLAEPGKALQWITKVCGGGGLRQFKLSFAPKVAARYAAAPNGAILLLAAPDVLLRIRYPDGVHFPPKTKGVQPELTEQAA